MGTREELYRSGLFRTGKGWAYWGFIWDRPAGVDAVEHLHHVTSLVTSAVGDFGRLAPGRKVTVSDNNAVDPADVDPSWVHLPVESGTEWFDVTAWLRTAVGPNTRRIRFDVQGLVVDADGDLHYGYADHIHTLTSEPKATQTTVFKGDQGIVHVAEHGAVVLSFSLNEYIYAPWNYEKSNHELSALNHPRLAAYLQRLEAAGGVQYEYEGEHMLWDQIEPTGLLGRKPEPDDEQD